MRDNCDYAQVFVDERELDVSGDSGILGTREARFPIGLAEAVIGTGFCRSWLCCLASREQKEDCEMMTSRQSNYGGTMEPGGLEA